MVPVMKSVGSLPIDRFLRYRKCSFALRSIDVGVAFRDIESRSYAFLERFSIVQRVVLLIGPILDERVGVEVS